MNNKIYTILVVDDEPTNIDILSSILKRSYKVVAATNGKKALDRCFSGKFPDLILLDVMMPELDGYHVCRVLKEDPRTTDIPIIFVTAKEQVEDKQKGLELGAIDYIAKPFSPLVVVQKVKKHLGVINDTLDFSKTYMGKHLKVKEWPLKGVHHELIQDKEGVHSSKFPKELYSIKTLDVNDGLKRFASNENLYIRSLSRFAETYENVVATLEEYLDQGDRESALRTAHSLKGVAGTIGAKNLFNLSEDLEGELGEGGVFKKINPDIIAEVSSLVASLKNALKEKVEVDYTDFEGMIDTVKLTSKFIQLRTMLQNDDTDAVDLLDEIFEDNAELKDLLLPIKMEIQSSRFEEALNHLMGLVKKFKIYMG